MNNTYKQNGNKNNFILDYFELTYLKLFIHNFSNLEICEFLNIDIKKSYYIRYCLFEKFNSNNWLEVINKAFKTGYLNKVDFIEDKTRTTSRIYAQIIFSKKSIPGKQLKTLLIDFYETCGNNLLEDKSKKIKEALLPKEIEFIRHHYAKMNNVQPLKPSTSNFIFLEKFEQNILYKLGVSNWFNAFRTAFQLLILEKSPYSIIQIDEKINKILEKLKQICPLQYNHFETKNTIYSLLNNLYFNIEFTYLTNNK